MPKIWLVEHPCDAGVKAKAAKDGCKVVDLRFKDSYAKEDIKKTILKDKPKKAVKEVVKETPGE